MNRIKITQEEYISILNELGNDEYQLVDGEIYQGTHQKLQIIHKTCGRITSISPKSFRLGQRCFYCSKEERIRKNREEKHKEFKNFLQDSTDGEYTILEGEMFVHIKHPLQLVHQTCGNLYRVRPDDFKNGSRCPKCRDRSALKKSHEQFVQEFSNSCLGEYELLDGQVYVNGKTPIKIRHKLCGYEYSINPDSFLRGHLRCSQCKINNKPTHNPEKFIQYKERIAELVGDEYSVLESSDFMNLKSSIVMRHNTCSYEYSTVADYFLKGSRCPNCLIDFRKKQVWSRKTQKEFSEEVLIKGEGNYELVEGTVYINNMTHVQMRHITCGYEYLVMPANFLQGRRCPNCNKLNRSQRNSKTHEIFAKEVRDEVEDEYVVLGTYINSNTKVKMKHSLCGYEWDIVPSSFLSGSRCPSCAKKKGSIKKRKTLDTFKKEMYELVQNEYKVKEGEVYVNNSSPIIVIHNACEHEYSVRPSNFLNGRRCPACSKKARGEKTRKNVDEFKQQVLEYGNQEYELTKNAVYINTDTPIEMQHIICGHVWNPYPAAFIRGSRCPNCNGGIKRTHDEFKQAVKEKGKGEYIVAPGEMYTNNHTHIVLIHTECETKYKTTPGNFLRGTRCPKCALLGMSKGEKAITDIFVENNIDFISQQTFEECKHKRPLRFDFAVYVEGNVKALVEYNGPQHYHEIDYFGGKEAFELTQLRDNIKRTYCEEQGIPLIEIRHDEEILPKLSEELLKVNVCI